MTAPPIGARTYVVLGALTLVAGYGDAVAFFGFGVFTANMTGNTVLLGGAIAGRVFGALPGNIGVTLPLISVVAFVGGALAAALLLRGRANFRRRALWLLSAVAALLAVTALLQRGHAPRTLSVALLSIVMGLQSLLAVRSGVGGVSTTYVTGTIVHAIDTLLGRPEPDAVARSEGRANAGVWMVYLAGAFAGTAGLRLLGAGALWVPAGMVALLTAVV
ncbi:MAG: YoaK family protein [Candidatus Tumulicola sp.]